jgi:hypothetical protein
LIYLKKGNPEMLNKKHALWVFLLFLIVVIFIALGHLYNLISNSSEPGAATLGISAVIIGLFTLCLGSMGITGLIVVAVRKGWIIPRAGSLLDMIVKLWRKIAPTYYHQDLGSEPEELITEEDIKEPWLEEFTLDDMDGLLNYVAAGKGRGRKSNKSDEIRFRIVRDWFILQMHGTSVKLPDFLEDHFGTHESGLPVVPTSTFYGWRKKFIKDLRAYKASKMK